MLREIRMMGDPVLRQKAAPVAEVDEDVRRLVDDMLETMYDADGIGLAAPQVGLLKRVLVIDIRDPEVRPFALVNPEILETGGESEKGEEGCLSIPGLRDIVERPGTCRVRGLDRNGDAVEIQADGLLARALQHEIDHLDGVLFVDRVSPLKRRLLLKKWQKIRPEGAAK